jgi:hypothetical protein
MCSVDGRIILVILYMYRSYAFKGVNDYFRTEYISWAKCFGICTDEAVIVTGNKKGFQAEIRKIALHANFNGVSFQRDFSTTWP